MPCYAVNPLFLSYADCLRTVCIHCRSDFLIVPTLPGYRPQGREIIAPLPAGSAGLTADPAPDIRGDDTH